MTVFWELLGYRIFQFFKLNHPHNGRKVPLYRWKKNEARWQLKSQVQVFNPRSSNDQRISQFFYQKAVRSKAAKNSDMQLHVPTTNLRGPRDYNSCFAQTKYYLLRHSYPSQLQRTHTVGCRTGEGGDWYWIYSNTSNCAQTREMLRLLQEGGGRSQTHSTHPPAHCLRLN